MTFHARNPYYLRISEKHVLPLYVYLDERHLDWMSDRVLQHVLEDLRPHILPKLKAESEALRSGGAVSGKKVTVDTHRGDTYQFCYFLRKTEPHSVMMKTRTFIAAPRSTKQASNTLPPAIPSYPPRPKRKSRATKSSAQGASSNGRKRRRIKGKGKAVEDSDTDEDLVLSSGSNSESEVVLSLTEQRRRSARTKKPGLTVHAGAMQAAGEDLPVDPNPSDRTEPNAGATVEDESQDPNLDNIDDDVVMHDTVASESIDLTVEEEESKPKPMLQLKYRGFNIYGQCLCIVIEPWPPMRFASRAPSVPAIFRAPSIAPPDFVSSAEAEARVRARTPLFLPDDDDDRRSATPAPFLGRRVLPPVPLFDDSQLIDDEDLDGGGGMMEFSQVLNAAGDLRAGATEDDDDIDGAVFFGDADEAREL